MLSRNEMIAYLDYAAQRLQTMANSSRGTVCDDDKVWALEMEVAAIKSARQIIAKEPQADTLTDPPRPPQQVYVKL